MTQPQESGASLRLGSGEDGIADAIPYVDDFMKGVLKSEKNRIVLKKLEGNLRKFIEGNTEKLEFPPMKQFQRNIIVHVAVLHRLNNELFDANDGSDNRGIRLMKTDKTAIPPIQFSQVPDSHLRPSSRSEYSIMTTKGFIGSDAAAAAAAGLEFPVSGRGKGGHGNRSRAQRTFEEREDDYAKARARILGGGGRNGGGGGDDDGGSGADNSPLASDSMNPSPPATQKESLNTSRSSRSPSPEASAPVKSPSLPSDNGTSPSSTTPAGRQPSGPTGKKASSPSPSPQAQSQPAQLQLRVKMRDRREDMRDPDFDRNYSRYAPRAGANPGAMVMAGVPGDFVGGNGASGVGAPGMAMGMGGSVPGDFIGGNGAPTPPLPGAAGSPALSAPPPLPHGMPRGGPVDGGSLLGGFPPGRGMGMSMGMGPFGSMGAPPGQSPQSQMGAVQMPHGLGGAPRGFVDPSNMLGFPGLGGHEGRGGSEAPMLPNPPPPFHPQQSIPGPYMGGFPGGPLLNSHPHHSPPNPMSPGMPTFQSPHMCPPEAYGMMMGRSGGDGMSPQPRDEGAVGGDVRANPGNPVNSRARRGDHHRASDSAAGAATAAAVGVGSSGAASATPSDPVITQLPQWNYNQDFPPLGGAPSK